MTSTKAEPGPFDAMEKARDDEPVFTLLGRDPDAPATIAFWVDRLARRALDTEADPREDERVRGELMQCTEAETVAWAMDNWRKGRPDAPAVIEKVAYSGVTIATTEAEARALALRAIHAELCEAAYHTNNAIEQLQAAGITAEQIHAANGKPGIPVFTLADALEAIHDADRMVAPRRRGTQPELPIEGSEA